MRAVPRRARGPRREPDRRGGKRVPLHPRRDERGAGFDRGGVHRRRAFFSRPGYGRMPRNGSSSVEPSGPTRASSFLWPLLTLIPKRPTSFGSAPRTGSTGASRPAPTPTWRSFSPPTRPGRRATPPFRRTAGSASRLSTTSSGSSARPVSTRSRPSRPT